MIAAFLLDLLLGDPENFPHPVRWIGKVAIQLEAGMVALLGRNRTSGVIFTLTIVGMSYGITAIMIQGLSQWNLWIGWGFHTFLLYTTFATRDLARHCQRVFNALKRGDLSHARHELSKMVGRDTEMLEEKEIVRGSVESVAENTVDGVISPIFYALIGGAPLAMAFKAASTLDSMVGHKTFRYLQFGWASARLDDFLNFIPARISIFLFPSASLFCNLSAMDSLRIALRDGQKSQSPNAGIPEAAVAGALGVRLGGVNSYQGISRPNPVIGDRKRELIIEDILRGNRLMVTCAVLFLIIGTGVRMWIR